MEVIKMERNDIIAEIQERDLQQLQQIVKNAFNNKLHKW